MLHIDEPILRLLLRNCSLKLTREQITCAGDVLLYSWARSFSTQTQLRKAAAAPAGQLTDTQTRGA